ncbi:MAG: hypothetical protein RIC24_14565 [Hyphomicrobiales bacterium]
MEIARPTLLIVRTVLSAHCRHSIRTSFLGAYAAKPTAFNCTQLVSPLTSIEINVEVNA